MHHASAIRRDTRPLWERFGVIVCLIAWFSATPALLPAAVAALGSLDGQHRVSLAAKGAQVAVVFHHPDAAYPQRHHHSPLISVLTAFAQSSGSTQDHVLAFTQTDAARLPITVGQLPVSGADLPLPSESFVLLSIPQPSDVPALAPRPLPTCGIALVCIRSTTLLI